MIKVPIKHGFKTFDTSLKEKKKTFKQDRPVNSKHYKLNVLNKQIFTLEIVFFYSLVIKHT